MICFCSFTEHSSCLSFSVFFTIFHVLILECLVFFFLSFFDVLIFSFFMFCLFSSLGAGFFEQHRRGRPQRAAQKTLHATAPHTQTPNGLPDPQKCWEAHFLNNEKMRPGAFFYSVKIRGPFGKTWMHCFRCMTFGTKNKLPKTHALNNMRCLVDPFF